MVTITTSSKQINRVWLGRGWMRRSWPTSSRALSYSLTRSTHEAHNLCPRQPRPSCCTSTPSPHSIHPTPYMSSSPTSFTKSGDTTPCRMTRVTLSQTEGPSRVIISSRQTSDFRVQGLGLGSKVQSLGSRVGGFGFRFFGYGFRVSGFGVRVSDFGFRAPRAPRKQGPTSFPLDLASSSSPRNSFVEWLFHGAHLKRMGFDCETVGIWT